MEEQKIPLVSKILIGGHDGLTIDDTPENRALYLDWKKRQLDMVVSICQDYIKHGDMHELISDLASNQYVPFFVEDNK